MAQTFDCIVVGCGGFGSSVLHHLASRGASVLGIERFRPIHDRGSSHGETRVIRKAYFEHPDYVPLLQDSFPLWRQLEAESGMTLLNECGLFIAGPPDGPSVSGAKLAAARHSLSIESFPPTGTKRDYKGTLIPAEFEIVVEHEAGYLFVERCQEACLQLAVAHGATLHSEETVIDWQSNGTSVEVTTDQGTYSAGSMVFTTGAWTNQLLSQLNVSLRVIRKIMTWHKSAEWSSDSVTGSRAGDNVFYFELPTGDFYGVPSSEHGLIKLAHHSGGMEVPDPLLLDRKLHVSDLQPIADFIRQHLPGVSVEPVRHAACMYSSTADGHFVIDQHPDFDNVVIGGGFSGHGFKFASVLGSALADLGLQGETDHAIDFLRLKRFE